MSRREHLEAAIAAHSAWKARFKKFMAGELVLDAQVVEKPDGCDFGKYLKGDGRADLGGAFGDIDAAHAHFHRVAAEVVRCQHGGKKAEAEKALETSGVFTQAGAKLTMLVVKARDA
ncbi:MAG: CZB domain-containing protein [Myxococcales bacterium]|nr:CZB domain-containing protein [Myxococcales bacterium]